jgi:hypothetical protein
LENVLYTSGLQNSTFGFYINQASQKLKVSSSTRVGRRVCQPVVLATIKSWRFQVEPGMGDILNIVVNIEGMQEKIHPVGVFTPTSPSMRRQQKFTSAAE